MRCNKSGHSELHLNDKFSTDKEPDLLFSDENTSAIQRKSKYPKGEISSKTTRKDLCEDTCLDTILFKEPSLVNSGDCGALCLQYNHMFCWLDNRLSGWAVHNRLCQLNDAIATYLSTQGGYSPFHQGADAAGRKVAHFGQIFRLLRETPTELEDKIVGRRYSPATREIRSLRPRQINCLALQECYTGENRRTDTIAFVSLVEYLVRNAPRVTLIPDSMRCRFPRAVPSLCAVSVKLGEQGADLMLLKPTCRDKISTIKVIAYSLKHASTAVLFAGQGACILMECGSWIVQTYGFYLTKLSESICLKSSREHFPSTLVPNALTCPDAFSNQICHPMTNVAIQRLMNGWRIQPCDGYLEHMDNSETVWLFGNGRSRWTYSAYVSYFSRWIESDSFVPSQNCFGSMALPTAVTSRVRHPVINIALQWHTYCLGVAFCNCYLQTSDKFEAYVSENPILGTSVPCVNRVPFCLTGMVKTDFMELHQFTLLHIIDPVAQWLKYLTTEMQADYRNFLQESPLYQTYVPDIVITSPNSCYFYGSCSPSTILSLVISFGMQLTSQMCCAALVGHSTTLHRAITSSAKLTHVSSNFCLWLSGFDRLSGHKIWVIQLQLLDQKPLDLAYACAVGQQGTRTCGLRSPFLHWPSRTSLRTMESITLRRRLSSSSEDFVCTSQSPLLQTASSASQASSAIAISRSFWTGWFQTCASSTLTGVALRLGSVGYDPADILPLSGVGLALAVCALICLAKTR
ncbi:unnamed protein product [Dicrocoelium dendriticum]|nr:unnamed protein product [Dicrocoelium dendriticum]